MADRDPNNMPDEDEGDPVLIFSDVLEKVNPLLLKNHRICCFCFLCFSIYQAAKLLARFSRHSEATARLTMPSKKASIQNTAISPLSSVPKRKGI
jgi:hypothetical protein